MVPVKNPAHHAHHLSSSICPSPEKRKRISTPTNAILANETRRSDAIMVEQTPPPPLPPRPPVSNLATPVGGQQDFLRPPAKLVKTEYGTPIQITRSPPLSFSHFKSALPSVSAFESPVATSLSASFEDNEVSSPPSFALDSSSDC